MVGAAWRSTGLKTDNKRNAYGNNSNNGVLRTEEPRMGVWTSTWDKEFVDDNVGLFAEFAAPVLESLDLSAAVRWDDYNHFDSDTTYSIGAVWRPDRLGQTAFEPFDLVHHPNRPGQGGRSQ